jgi:uroporphyrinogen-III synthase
VTVERIGRVRLLVTRPERQGEATAARLRAGGHDVLRAPMLQVEAVVDAALSGGPWSGVIMTSRNAAHVIARHPLLDRLCGLPVFVVGRSTALATRAAGFSDVRSADGDADDLVRLILSSQAGLHGPLLYLAGTDRAADIVGDLRADGVPAEMVAVYRAVAAEAFPAAVRDALAADRIDGVLHLSRRSAETYLACARTAGLLGHALTPVHYCLSAQVAEPLAAAGAHRIEVAPRPDESALIGLVPP